MHHSTHHPKKRETFLIDTLIIFLLEIYRKTLSPFLQTIFGTKNICRYSPSCSVYTQNMIRQHGVIHGICLGIKRLLTCQPFYKQSYV